MPEQTDDVEMITIGDESTIIIQGTSIPEVEGKLRRPRGLSPSALKMYLGEPDRYIEQYLCPVAPPKFKQILPMAVGSAFDSFVKGNINKVLGLGDNTIDLFRSSIEVTGEDLELAKYYGWYCFQCYKQCGALASLLLDLKYCDISTLRMEHWMENDMPCSQKILGELDGLGLAGFERLETFHVWGKPDLSVMRGSNPIILDWKVNGLCSKSSTSPKKGYVRQWATRNKSVPIGIAPDWQLKAPHKAVLLGYENGILHDLANQLDYCDDEWALQCCTYGWLNNVYEQDLFVGIDQITSWGIESMVDVTANQLASNWPETSIGLPAVRISSFRNKIQVKTQRRYQELYTLLWNIVKQPEDKVLKQLFYSCHPTLKEEMGVIGSEERFNAVIRGASYVGGVGSTFLDDGRDV